MPLLWLSKPDGDSGLVQASTILRHSKFARMLLLVVVLSATAMVIGEPVNHSRCGSKVFDYGRDSLWSE